MQRKLTNIICIQSNELNCKYCNLSNYDIKNITIEIIDLNKIVNIEDELAIRRMKKEVGVLGICQ